MIKKMVYRLFGSYFFDRRGISRNSTIAYSYTPELNNESHSGVKLTSDSKWRNFFYWLYKS